MKFWKGSKIASMTGNNIFVFGSNPEGRHGLGAAKAAMQFGAKYGRGRGRSGNTYALVTKNLTAGFIENLTGIQYNEAGEGSVSMEMILENIKDLYLYARMHKELKFFVAYQANSKNLNGYSAKEMFKLFTSAGKMPDNIRMHNSFRGMHERKKSG